METNLNEITNQAKRPTILTVLCVILGIFALWAIVHYVIASGVSTNEEYAGISTKSIFNLSGFTGIINLGAVIGLWTLKKWGAYLLFFGQALTDLQLIMASYIANKGDIETSIIVSAIAMNIIFIVPTIFQFKKLR